MPGGASLHGRMQKAQSSRIVCIFIDGISADSGMSGSEKRSSGKRGSLRRTEAAYFSFYKKDFVTKSFNLRGNAGRNYASEK